MADPVSIIVWRDAKTNQPSHPHAVVSEEGVLVWYRRVPGRAGGTWCREVDGTPLNPPPARYAELPILPSDPSERLTTNDVEMAANACEDEAREVQSRGSRRGREVWERRARRLRAALPGKEGRTCEP